MTKEEIFNKLSDMLVEQFEIEKEKITLEANIVNDLDLDSIDMIDLIATLRRESNISFTPEDYKNVRTIANIVDAIYNKLNENKN
ncbi:MAG: acyl carrier protein [Succinivibrionaceae bacterium]|nr:acyl carrier protein [Ruminobacter sp.]MDY5779949.1 acyl carrier protein [Succinivibrionaceae bacterium]MEE1341033.1 acyl carrier protein [Succinivibrionaceae bacterium]